MVADNKHDVRGRLKMIELYESQRAMRAMRKAALQRGVVAVLDVGTSKIACLVLRFGEIDAMVETERAIRTAVQAAQKMANIRVDHVIACFSGAEPRSYGLAGQVELEGHTVSEQDISRVLSACDVPDYGDGREVLHAQPVNFALDHRTGLIDPRGQMGQVLSTDMHMLTVDGAAIQNLAHCVKRCD